MESSLKIQEIALNFTRDIESVAASAPLAVSICLHNKNKNERDFVSFLKKMSENVNEEEHRTGYEIPLRFVHEVIRKERALDISRRAVGILPKSLFVSMVSIYDAFLGNLYKNIAENKPEILGSGEKTIALDQLAQFDTKQEIYSFFIEKEVEGLLRESHSEQFAILEKKFGIKLKAGLVEWPAFVELTQRRNLLVHADGLVSRQYLEVCRGCEVAVDDGATLGKKVEISEAYFRMSYLTLYKIGVKLSQVLWRKIFPDDLEKADESLNNIIYRILVNEDYELCEAICEFGHVVLKKHFDEKSRRIIIINRAIANKLAGNSLKCADLLAAEDWSVCDLEFKLALKVLGDDFEGAANTMGEIGKIKEEQWKANYREWPLFKAFRETNEFQKKYLEVYGESFIETEITRLKNEEGDK